MRLFNRSYFGALAATLVATACEPSSLVRVEAASTVVDPATVATADGALKLYTAAVSQFAFIFGGAFNPGAAPNNLIMVSASITDELALRPGSPELMDYRDQGS